MNQISEFYTKAMADRTIKETLTEILDGVEIEQADDRQLNQIGELAKELGYEITLDEVKEFLNPAKAELEDADLDAVAGGKGVRVYERNYGDCVEGIGGIQIKIQ